MEGGDHIYLLVFESYKHRYKHRGLSGGAGMELWLWPGHICPLGVAFNRWIWRVCGPNLGMVGRPRGNDREAQRCRVSEMQSF